MGDPGVRCLKGKDGLCPIRDKSPQPFPSNEEVVRIFRFAERSAQQIVGKKKTYIYLRMADIESLMRIFEIPLEDRQDILERLSFLEELANKKRKQHPRASTGNRR